MAISTGEAERKSNRRSSQGSSISDGEESVNPHRLDHFIRIARITRPLPTTRSTGTTGISRMLGFHGSFAVGFRVQGSAEFTCVECPRNPKHTCGAVGMAGVYQNVLNASLFVDHRPRGMKAVSRGIELSLAGQQTALAPPLTLRPIERVHTPQPTVPCDDARCEQSPDVASRD